MRLYEKEKRMRAACPERDFVCFDEIDSTNTYLKANISPSMPVAVADRQLAGRGRQGRSFFSEGGVYFSVPFVFDSGEKYISFLTLAAGLAVSQAISELCSADTLIKWPNDIYFDGRKICGILCESVVSGGTVTVIAGIGINTGAAAFPDDISSRALSLADAGFAVDGEKLVCSIVRKLDSFVYIDKITSGDSPGVGRIVSELNRLSYTVGRRVTYAGREYTAVRIERDGALILASEDGHEERAVWGEVNISQ